MKFQGMYTKIKEMLIINQKKKTYKLVFDGDKRTYRTLLLH